MNKFLKLLVFIAIFLIIIKKIVYGSEEKRLIEEQINLLDLKNISSVLGDAEKPCKINFKEMIVKAILGELDLSPTKIFKSIIKILFEEIYSNLSLIKELIVIAILSSILRNITSSFKSKSIGELGFYVCYILLVIVLFSSFKIVVKIIESLVFTLTNLIHSMMPLIISLLFMSGNITGIYIFNTILIFMINLINMLMRDFFMPILILISILQIVNYLTENEILSNLSELAKTIVSWSLKGIAFCFISILTLQRISSPILNNLVLKTAKSTINIVPIVGEILTSSIDFVSNWVQATKSGILIAVLISIFLICAIPILKLIALIFIYKFTAAIIQPICDKRIVKCIDSIGSYTTLLLGIGVTVVITFLFATILVLSF